MRVTGLVLVRTGWYVTLGVVFGMLAFMRTNAYKRRTGSSPWHIHPVVWGVVSVFVAFLVTLLSIVFVAVFGTLVSIVAWSPRSQLSRERSGSAAASYAELGELAPISESVPMAGPVPPPQRATALKAWLSDPTGRNELRYFDGSGWTEHVANNGVISVDRL